MSYDREESADIIHVLKCPSEDLERERREGKETDKNLSSGFFYANTFCGRSYDTSRREICTFFLEQRNDYLYIFKEIEM